MIQGTSPDQYSPNAINELTKEAVMLPFVDCSSDPSDSGVAYSLHENLDSAELYIPPYCWWIRPASQEGPRTVFVSEETADRILDGSIFHEEE
tara:strand:- start:988 stop:1266 length:279 start_codon:yes stop_codon:yes gene_type:complete